MVTGKKRPLNLREDTLFPIQPYNYSLFAYGQFWRICTFLERGTQESAQGSESCRVAARHASAGSLHVDHGFDAGLRAHAGWPGEGHPGVCPGIRD